MNMLDHGTYGKLKVLILERFGITLEKWIEKNELTWPTVCKIVRHMVKMKKFVEEMVDNLSLFYNCCS